MRIHSVDITTDWYGGDTPLWKCEVTLDLGDSHNTIELHTSSADRIMALVAELVAEQLVSQP